MFHLFGEFLTASCPSLPSHISYNLVSRKFKSSPIFHTLPILKYCNFRKWTFIIYESSALMLRIFIFIRTLSCCYICMVFLRKWLWLSTGAQIRKGDSYGMVGKGIKKGCFRRWYKTVKQIFSIPLACLPYKLGISYFHR